MQTVVKESSVASPRAHGSAPRHRRHSRGWTALQVPGG